MTFYTIELVSGRTTIQSKYFDRVWTTLLKKSSLFGVTVFRYCWVFCLFFFGFFDHPKSILLISSLQLASLSQLGSKFTFMFQHLFLLYEFIVSTVINPHNLNLIISFTFESYYISFGYTSFLITNFHTPLRVTRIYSMGFIPTKSVKDDKDTEPV